MNTIKILFLSLIFVAPLLLSACGSGGERAGSNEGSNADITFTTPLPESLHKHWTDLTVDLEAVHQESGELRTTQLTINDVHQVSEKPSELKVSGKITELKVGSYVFTTTYRLNDVVVGTQTSIGVVEANNSTSISFSELTLPDDDKDGLTNLKEVLNGTDPDDPGSPSQSVSIDRDISAREAGLPFNFTVSLSKPDIEEVTVEYATQNNTAIDGLDYSATSGVLTFSPGVTQQSIRITILDDATDEAEETFNVMLSNPSANTTIFDGTRVGTIADDDGLPTVSISDIEPVLEAEGLATFTVSLSNTISEVVTVDFNTGNLSAIAGTDYTENSGTLTFDPGVTQQTIDVVVLDDETDEPTKTFNITLSNPSTNITIVNGRGLGTIVDDDGLPTVSISDIEPVLEAGGLATFTVSLSNAISEVVTVDFSTGNLSAIAGIDYTETTGTLTFDPRVTELAVDILILDDPTDESEETFNVTLSNSSTNATIVNGIGVATIADDDGLPTVSINDPLPVTEMSGVSTFTVSLSNASTELVTVDFTTGNLSAILGSDYIENTGTLTFDPGVTELAVDIAVLDDTSDEPQESFNVMLSNPSANATIIDDIGVATITDDDGPTVSIDDPAFVSESGGLVTFTVSLSKITSEAVTVDFSTGDLSASAGSDYTVNSGTLTFDPGVTRQAVTVTILDDNIGESNETFNVGLSNASANATILDGNGMATITDDDKPTLSIHNAGVVQESGGSATFNVSLSNASSEAVTVAYTTGNLTATAGKDFTTKSGTLTFAPGELRKSITAVILNDSMDEPNETFSVVLSNSSTNATIAGATGLGIILDDDPKPTLRINDVSASESSASTTFTVSLSNPSNTTVTVQYTTGNGTATAGKDYVEKLGTLAFSPGVTQQSIRVSMLNENLDEPNESFGITLSRPSTNATIADGTGLATIIDDDPTPALTIYNTSVHENINGSLAVFQVHLSNPSSTPVTVYYKTSNISSANAGFDYTKKSGTLTFAPGVTQQTISISILNDIYDESSEAFMVSLRGLSANFRFLDNTGVGTIIDNDHTVTVPAIKLIRPNFIPPHILNGGNTDFSGHGPSVTVQVSLSVKNDREVWAKIYMNAVETNWARKPTGDRTTARGSKSFPIYTHDKVIAQILSPTDFDYRYRDTDHENDRFLTADGSLILDITGDTNGRDAAKRTGVTLEFRYIEIVEER